MRRLLALAAVVFGILMLPLAAGAAQPQAIRIESWLQRVPDTTNPLVQGEVRACAKVWIGSSAVVTGGGPTWTTPASYAGTADMLGKCTDWTPVGGYRFEGQGHLNNPTLDNVLFARHEIQLTGGSIFIQFVGKYSPTFAGSGNWVIKGGTGTFEGLRGTGTWEAQGAGDATGLYFMHTEVGTVHWTGK